MKKNNKIFVEKKRIRWSTLSNTTLIFSKTIIFIIIFTIFVVLFSYGAENFLNFLSK